MIVVDTNVIFYFLNGATFSNEAQRLFEEDSEWIAPRLWLDEFLNIVATYERNGMIESPVANEILELAMDLMQERTFDLPPRRVLAVARRTGCSTCDSQYIALAEELGLKLYTWDKKILRACPGLAEKPS